MYLVLLNLIFERESCRPMILHPLVSINGNHLAPVIPAIYIHKYIHVYVSLRSTSAFGCRTRGNCSRRISNPDDD